MEQTHWYLQRIGTYDCNTLFPLKHNSLIGSNKHAQVRVFGESITKHHCFIQINDNQIKILDTSKKGIFINGQLAKFTPCGIFQELFHNDVIKLNNPSRRTTSDPNNNSEVSFILKNIDYLPLETIDLTESSQQHTLIQVSSMNFNTLENQQYNMI